MTGPQQTYLPSSAVRARYGVSDMTIWRWLQNDKLGFPAPLRINGRRYWRLIELETWEGSGPAQSRAAGVAAEKNTPPNSDRPHEDEHHWQTGRPV
jgi:predicted DNA-binding transcriptional regulator AlpA